MNAKYKEKTTVEAKHKRTDSRTIKTDGEREGESVTGKGQPSGFSYSYFVRYFGIRFSVRRFVSEKTHNFLVLGVGARAADEIWRRAKSWFPDY